MQNHIKSKCDMCRSEALVAHFDLFCFGSEGIGLCQDCRIVVCDFIIKKAMEALRHRRDEYMERSNL